VPATLKQAADRARAKVERLQKEIDAEHRMRDLLADGLGAWLDGAPDDAAAKALVDLERRGLRDRDAEARAFRVRALGATKRPRARKLLLARLEVEKDYRLLPRIVDALARPAGDEAVAVLVGPLFHERWQVRAAAAAGLARIGSPEAIQPLIDRLRLEEGRLRGDIALALRILTDENHGTSPERWQTWWDANRGVFVPPKDRPPPEEAAKKEGEEEEGDGKEPQAAPPPAEDRPSFYGIEILSKRVVFVIDVSGSMNEPATSYEGDRTKIEVAKRELRNAILALPDDAWFNVVSYASEVSVWRKGMIPAKRKERLAAKKLVDRMTAEGGTNIHGALLAAFEIAEKIARSKRDERSADTIFFLSDGQPTRGDILDAAQILAEVKRWNERHRIKIHAVGVGRDHAEAFMKDLAESTGGTYVRR
jgi:uncharacterized protein YegL